MKSKIITGVGSIIALLYTLLMIFTVGGFERVGVINNAIDFLDFGSGNIYGVILFVFFVAALVLYYIAISKNKSNIIGGVLIVSFVIGTILLMLVIKVHPMHKYLFDFYMTWFYHEVLYEGEDKIPQVFSFISRLMTFCFFCGSVISFFIIKYINRNMIKV